MVNYVNILTTSFNQMGVQLANIIPKLIITLIIWWVGKYLVELGVNLIKRIDIKGTDIDNKVINTFSGGFYAVGKVILVLIILDYWGIGKTIISALTSGLTYTFAIALGLAFGKALEPEAKDIVKHVKKKLKASKK